MTWRCCLSLGLSRLELTILLLLEAMGLAVLGTAFGVLLGVALSVASWLPARDYLGLEPGFRLFAEPFIIGALAALLATLLFVGVTGISTGLRPLTVTGHQPRKHWMRDWGQWRFSTLGILFTAALTALLGILAVGWRAGIALTLLALALALLLNAGSGLLTRFYWRLPAPDSKPLWALAVQGLARHRAADHRPDAGNDRGRTGSRAGRAGLGRRQRAGYLSALGGRDAAGRLRQSGADGVSSGSFGAAAGTGAAGGAGPRRGRVRRLILLENGIVAVAGGALGAALAVALWWLVGSDATQTAALTVLVIALLDVLAALAAAWIGALPVLWLISRQPPAASLRDRPWLTG